MASTFTTNFGIEKIGTGEQSGTWGTTTNYNIDILDRVTSYKTVSLSDAATATLTVRAGSPSSGSSNLQDGMYRVIKFSGSLSQACTITIAPATTTAYFIIQNATSGSQNIIMKQGSGAATVTIANAKADIVYADASDEVISLGSKLGVSFDIVGDTSPQLGGNLDMNGNDIVTTSNATIDLAPNGTGTVVVRGNNNPGTVVFNCESNSHGQTVKSQPHSASVTNVLTLPPGGNGEIVSTVATQTLTNKTIGVAQLSGQVAVAKGGTGSSSLSGANIVTSNANTTFTKAIRGATSTANATGSTVLDFDSFQNFVLTFTGNVTLANPSTESIGQSGIIMIVQDGTGSRTLSLGTDYETAGAAGLTISTAANSVDIVPYFVQSAGNILLGAPQLAFA